MPLRHIISNVGITMAVAMTALPHAAFALTDAEAALERAMPTPMALDRLKEQLEREPDNLDAYYEYATLARTLKQPDEAIWAYQQMLMRNPKLERVRLELGMVYAETGQFSEAESEFTAVLASNPPPSVEKNIRTVLAALKQQSKTHFFTGSFSLGYNLDTNANAAPGSGNVTVLDTTIPLSNASGEKTDAQVFTSLGINHTYQPADKDMTTPWQWKTSALAYRSEQNVLNNLNINLYSIQSGPEIFFPENKAKLSASLGYTHLELDNKSYLGNPKLNASLEKVLEHNVTVYYKPLYEFRSFMNSDTNTTFRSRTGAAWQHQLGFKVPVSAKSQLDVSYMHRREQAKELYFTNHQSALVLSYLRSLGEKTFMTVGGGYRVYEYELPDLLISTKTREDNEYTASIMVGHKFTFEEFGDIVGTVGYQFRDIDSNIQNYEYENHRLQAVLTRNF